MLQEASRTRLAFFYRCKKKTGNGRMAHPPFHVSLFLLALQPPFFRYSRLVQQLSG